MIEKTKPHPTKKKNKHMKCFEILLNPWIPNDPSFGGNGVEKVYTFPENPHSIMEAKKKKTTQKLHIFKPQCFRCELAVSNPPQRFCRTRRLEELHHVGMVKPTVPKPGDRVIEWRSGWRKKPWGDMMKRCLIPNKKPWLKWWGSNKKTSFQKKMIMIEFGLKSFNKNWRSH